MLYNFLKSWHLENGVLYVRALIKKWHVTFGAKVKRISKSCEGISNAQCPKSLKLVQ